MSFVLPGNARSLRFTGEAKALAPTDAPRAGASALGKPRVRKPPPPPPHARIATPTGATHITTPSPGAARVVTPLPSSGRDLYRADAIPTPYIGAINAPVMRDKFESVSDENPTMAMDRDAFDVLPGGNALRTPKPTAAPGAPAIPHFRAQPIQPAALAPRGTGSKTIKTAGAPYAVWVFASILAGIISYHVAPEILARLETPAHASP